MAVAFAPPAAGRCRALDLEALLVWTIRDQKADQDHAAWFESEAIVYNAERAGISYRGQRVEFCRPSADGCATILDRYTVGTEIDGGGAIRGIRPRVHPDAELVAEAIERLPASERRVILHHARYADRPDWLPLASPWVAVKRPSDARGRYRHVIAEAWEATPKQSEVAQRYFLRGISLFDRLGRRRITEEERGFRFRVLGDATRQLLVRWCPLEPQHSDAEIVETNEAYLFWHGAMVALGDSLARASLCGHTLTGFTAPERPWNVK